MVNNRVNNRVENRVNTKVKNRNSSSSEICWTRMMK